MLLMLLTSFGATALRAQTTATPVITLATGTYIMPTSTTITDSTPGESIKYCYATTGTCTPATPYTASIYLDPTSTETLCAFATASGFTQSSTVCNYYTAATAQTSTPVITLATGTYVMPTSTTITDSNSGAPAIEWCYVNSGICTPATTYTASIYFDPPSTETICA